jgi:ABC-type transport system substrate-binding protein/ABC-type dipeptide/oligopeptide/nickel transport system permease component
MRLLLPLLLALAGPALARDRLTVALQLEPPTLDPTSGAAAAIDEVTYRTIFEGLTTLDPTGRAVPLLATRWDMAPDARSYVFHLRPNVRFQDGTPFDAHVVAFSLMRATASGSSNALAEALGEIEAVEMLDPLTVRIRLRTADAALPSLLAYGDAVMVAPQSVANLATRPIGTGPFRFADWRRGDRLTLVRNDAYWGAKPSLARLDFRFIADPAAAYAATRGHAIDLFPDYPAPENLAGLARDPSLKVVSGPSEAEVILALNNARGPFNDIRVRRAIAHAIDRRAIIDGAMYGYGTPIGSHFPPQSPDHVDLAGLYPHDIARARALLAEAGYPHGFAATLKLPPPSYARRSGEVVAAQLRAIGIRVTIVPVEWAQWLDEIYTRHAFDMTIVAHVEPFDYAIYGRSDYYFGYDGTAVRALLDRLRATSDPAARHALLGAIQRRIADDAVNGFLFELPHLTVADSRVSGALRNSPVQATDFAAAHFASDDGVTERRQRSSSIASGLLFGATLVGAFVLLVRRIGPRWLLGRLAVLIVTLLGASLLVFGLLQVAPGDPAQFMMGIEGSPRAVAALRSELGLTGSVVDRYLRWTAGLLHGDLGLSYSYRVPVADLVRDAVAVSLPLAGMALLFSIVVGVPGALLAARRPAGLLDRAIGIGGEIGLAIPAFWLGMLILVGGAVLGWRGVSDYIGWDAGIASGLWSLAVPAVVLGVPQAAVVLRVTRAALGRELAADYVRTALAKGLGRDPILARHVLPNAAAPILTVIGLQVPFLLAGSVLVENVFALPGLGRLALQAIAARDLVTVQAVVMLVVAVTVATSFLVDIAQALVDPRTVDAR